MTKSEKLTENATLVAKLTLAKQLIKEVFDTTGEMAQSGSCGEGWVNFSTSIECVEVGISHLILEQCDLESDLDYHYKE